MRKTKHLAHACKATGCRPFLRVSSPQTLFFTDNCDLKVVITANRWVFRNRSTASWNKNYRKTAPKRTQNRITANPYAPLQILFLLRALMWRRSANIQFANFKIDFFGNHSEYRKSLTLFCSQSPTDWRCAVCLVARASKKAGNSV